MLVQSDDSAARLAAIVASADDAIIGKDLNGNITSWNQAAERLFGYTAGEAIGQHITLIIPDDRRAEENYVLAEVRAGNGVDPYETVRRRKDGTVLDISLTVSPIRTSSGEIIGASKIARDISEQRRLERDAQRLAAIIEWSDDAIVSKDLNGTIQTWNRGAERIFGFTAGEAVGRSITIIIPADRYQEEDTVLRCIRAGQAVDHFETVRRHKEGRLIDISLTVSPIRTSNGQVIGASKIARDITEQKRLRRAAEDASRAKDLFLATLSHELRTPLNTVVGYTAMLRSDALAEDQRTRALEVIDRNASALTELVNEVIDTSRIVTGKLRINLQPCDVAVIAEQAIESLRPALDAKGLGLTTDIARAQMVNGDPDRLRQVLWNVLSNAVKFTPAGGHVTVTVAPCDRSVRVAVQDTGIGLAAEALPLVFQRFWQATEGEAREHGGLGLGLALVRHFVELHGGQIAAASAGLGQGSTFEILLPALG